MKNYSISKSFIKGVTAFMLFAIPVFMQVTPEEYLNLTIGALAVMLLNALKFYTKQNLIV